MFLGWQSEKKIGLTQGSRLTVASGFWASQAILASENLWANFSQNKIVSKRAEYKTLTETNITYNLLAQARTLNYKKLMWKNISLFGLFFPKVSKK